MRILFSLGAALLISATCMAQLPVNVGLKGGLNYSFTSVDGFSGFDSENAAGFVVGAFGRLKIKKWSLQAEALYTGVNGKLTAAGQDADTRFSTLDVPILAGRKFLDLKVVEFRVLGGIVQSFVLNDNGDLQSDNYRDGYTSLAIGASVDIPLFLFDVRYQHGLGNFYEQPDLPFLGGGGDLSNNMLVLSVGWKIL